MECIIDSISVMRNPAFVSTRSNDLIDLLNNIARSRGRSISVEITEDVGWSIARILKVDPFIVMPDYNYRFNKDRLRYPMTLVRAKIRTYEAFLHTFEWRI